MSRKLVLATPPNQYFLERLVQHAREVSPDGELPFDLRPPVSPALFKEFGDGEYALILPRGPKGNNYVRGRKVLLLAGTPIWRRTWSDPTSGQVVVKETDGFNYAHDALQGLAHCGVTKVDCVFQYWGYSRQERFTSKHEHPIGCYRAATLGWIGQTADYRVDFHHLDLHADANMMAHGVGVGLDHDYCERFHVEIIKDLIEKHGRENLVIATTDASRAGWAKAIAQNPEVRLPLAIIIKEHVDVEGDAGAIDGVQSLGSAGLDRCKGKIVILFDDMIGSGKSVINAATEVMDAGATGVIADASHGVLQGNAMSETLAGAMYGDKPLLMEVHVLDTLEWAVSIADSSPRENFYHVHSAVPLIYDKFFVQDR